MTIVPGAAEIRAGCVEAAAGLVERGFARFVAHDFDSLGRISFRGFTNAVAIRERLATGGCGALARLDGVPVGYGEVAARRGGSGAHLLLLFTDPDCLRRGVVRALLQHLLVAGAPISRLSVNAVPFALPAYECLGFVATGPCKTRNGFVVTPMRHDGDPDSAA